MLCKSSHALWKSPRERLDNQKNITSSFSSLVRRSLSVPHDNSNLSTVTRALYSTQVVLTSNFATNAEAKLRNSASQPYWKLDKGSFSSKKSSVGACRLCLLHFHVQSLVKTKHHSFFLKGYAHQQSDLLHVYGEAACVMLWQNRAPQQGSCSTWGH